MNVLDSSLTYRAVAWFVGVVTVACRDSLAGRGLAAFSRGISRVFSGSWTFGLQRVDSRPLSWDGHPWSVLLIARPLLWLRRELVPVAAGARDTVAESGFAAGRWLTAVGAAVFGLGCGRLLSGMRGGGGMALADADFLSGLFFIVAGGVVALCGPRLVPAFYGSLLFRGARRVGVAVMEGRTAGSVLAAPAAAGTDSWPDTGPDAERAGRFTWIVWLGVLLALVAGLEGGLSAEPLRLVMAGTAVLLTALVLRRPEVFLLVGAAFPWVNWLARRTLGGFGPVWDDAFLLLSVVLLIWAVLFLRRARLWTVPILLPLLLSVAAAIGSVAVNEVRSDVAIYALRVLFQPILLYFLAFLFPKNRRWVQWSVGLFVLVGVSLSLHGLYQYLTDAPMPASWVDRTEDLGTRAYSIVANPNGLAAFLLMGVFVSLSMALRSGLRPLQRWVMAVACAVQLGGVAVTFSRGAWLGLVAGAVALFIMGYRRYLVPLATVGVLGWFAVPAKFTNRLLFAFTPTYIAKSMTAGRLLVWKMAVSKAVANPLFGVGLGTFGGATADTFDLGPYWVDNFYLQLAAEGGLVLLILFLWLLLRAGKGLVKAHGATSDPYMRALTVGVFGGFIALVVANFTAAVWETLVVGAAFWFLTGLASAAPVQLKESEAAAPANGAAPADPETDAEEPAPGPARGAA